MVLMNFYRIICRYRINYPAKNNDDNYYKRPEDLRSFHGYLIT